jgi:glycosyltransferase involved in cell wall biosynthesis
VRLAYVITRADAVGGATIHVRDLARAMLDLGHEVRVFVGGSGPVTEQLGEVGVPFVPLEWLGRPVHPYRDLRAYRELRRAVRAFRPDLVSTHTAKAGWLGRAAARAERIPSVYTPHGWAISDRISMRQGVIYTVAERIAAPWADAIVCVSESEKALALEKRVAPPEKLHVIHNGVRDVPAELLARPGVEPVTIVSVARLEAPKDHRTLLRAAAQAADLPWRLEVVGEGPLLPELQREANRLGISGRVEFGGYQADTPAILSRSSIFLLCSRSEGFPRSILEAMRAGLPVIASDVGGVGEAVIDGLTGILVPAGDAPAVARALRRLLTSASDRERMGSAGRQRYRERFEFNCMLNNTLGLYATIVVVPPEHTE